MRSPAEVQAKIERLENLLKPFGLETTLNLGALDQARTVRLALLWVLNEPPQDTAAERRNSEGDGK